MNADGVIPIQSDLWPQPDGSVLWEVRLVGAPKWRTMGTSASIPMAYADIEQAVVAWVGEPQASLLVIRMVSDPPVE